MTKPYPPMQCGRCGRKLLRAAALSNGRPVGPACAVALGLISKSPDSSASVAKADTQTLDLFSHTHNAGA